MQPHFSKKNNGLIFLKLSVYLIIVLEIHLLQLTDYFICNAGQAIKYA